MRIESKRQTSKRALCTARATAALPGPRAVGRNHTHLQGTPLAVGWRNRQRAAAGPLGPAREESRLTTRAMVFRRRLRRLFSVLRSTYTYQHGTNNAAVTLVLSETYKYMYQRWYLVDHHPTRPNSVPTVGPDYRPTAACASLLALAIKASETESALACASSASSSAREAASMAAVLRWSASDGAWWHSAYR